MLHRDQDRAPARATCLVIASYGAGTGERWSDRILDTARTHQIRLPRSVILLSKALVLIESLALRLDPEFSLQAVMRSFAPELSELRFREVGAKTKHAALRFASEVSPKLNSASVALSTSPSATA